ncbi:MAG: S-layer homology domain-containing protein [Firmicutes bacterium]|nr:S-layer homology domain-containing protein [Bacillota bacterium]
MPFSKHVPRGRSLILIFSLILLLFALAPAEAQAADIGSQWGYTLVHEVQVVNRGTTTARNISVEVPLADEYDSRDRLYCQIVGQELTPYPMRVYYDEEGRRVGLYSIDRLAPGQSVILTQRYARQVGAVNYGLDPQLIPEDYSYYDRRMLEEYLQPTSRIQSDAPEVISFTENALAGETALYDKARALFSAVNLYLEYSTAAADQSARATLVRGYGSCDGYVNLYMACLRAAGVACRQVDGYLFQPAIHVTDEYTDQISGVIRLERLRHTWVEFYLPGPGWLPADPTFTYSFLVNGEEQKFVNWSYFANVSAANRYIAFREGDPSADTIRLLSATGGQVELDFSAKLAPGIDYLPFPDIAGHWAAEPIRYCVENGLFNGVSAQSFAPDASMTRAMFVTVLGRLYEKINGSLPETGFDADFYADFYDVVQGSYYEPYVTWAAANGIVSGYGDGRFGPDDPVTREQMGTIMASFLRAAGYGDQVTMGSISNFGDAGDVHGWAAEGVAVCVGCGLLSGYPDGCFYPQDQATRAQVAAILERLNRWIAGRSQGV